MYAIDMDQSRVKDAKDAFSYPFQCTREKANDAPKNALFYVVETILTETAHYGS